MVISMGIGSWFNKGIGDSRFRLQTISHDIANNEAAIARMKKDAAKYQSAVQRDKDGNPVNSLVLDDCKYKDEQNMGIVVLPDSKTSW